MADSSLKSLIKHRNFLESYIKNHPTFRTSLLPLPEDDLAPPIIRDMLSKSKICGVGPMASVAGAVSEFVGYDLLDHRKPDYRKRRRYLFKKKKKNNPSLFTPENLLSYKVNILVKPEDSPLGICTSSATVGPSLSFGKADAVCVISKSATLADAAASAIGNSKK